MSLRTVVRFPEIEWGDSPYSSSGTAKLYLVVQDDKDTSAKRKVNVVMVVPQPKYMTRGQIDSLDFFYEGHFNGVLFYSGMSGKMIKVEVYINGEPYTRGQIAEEDSIFGTTLLATVRFYYGYTDESDIPSVAYVAGASDD